MLSVVVIGEQLHPVLPKDNDDCLENKMKIIWTVLCTTIVPNHMHDNSSYRWTGACWFRLIFLHGLWWFDVAGWLKQSQNADV